MKKLVPFSFFFCFFYFAARAEHITGGEMSYTYEGTVSGSHQYHVTLKLYMRCNSGRVFNDPTIISIFHRTGNTRVMDLEVALSRSENISLSNPDPCISNPPVVCYDVGYYEFYVSLPPTPDGYILAGQVNFRVAGIENLVNGYNQIGATYTTEIPGTASYPDDVKNNSAKFTGSDLVIVCANNPFTYSFGAEDVDGDQLRYSFCEAYRSSSGPSGGGGNNATAPLTPPYQSVPYGNSYDGSAPLGANVKIDSKTGRITGIAPGSGIYVVTVCVEEIRNSKVIAIQRKDLQIAITSCSLTAAILLPEYLLCKDTKTISLSNLSMSTLINDYYWELKNTAGNTILTTTTSTVSYTFPDTGIYYIKLVINRNQRCTDSTSSIARVYPGFIPAFNFQGICFTKPTEFRDATTTVYGTVNSWKWDFGDNAASGDSSLIQRPVYTYADTGQHNARLEVTNTKGCRDTLIKSIAIFEKPPVTLAFRDTLICPPDRLQLQASGRGTYSWTSAGLITNANTASPTVAPPVTTIYYVIVDDDGCLNQDSVTVRVTDKVNVAAMNDTTVCQGDSFKLRIQSNGLIYNWTPSAQLDNPAIADPVATTFVTTVYNITASISNCTANDQVMVKAVPYPMANAGTDTMICFKTTARLNGTGDGNKFSWSPASSLNNSNILNPVARPEVTTTYILTVSDNKGCPKPVNDSVLVTVLSQIEADAGRDTAVVMGESLQLTAVGGTGYFWQPSFGLSAVDIANPVALYDEPFETIRYKVLVYNLAGCVDSAFISVRIFSTKPTVFVPSGFTPNGDGKNDLLRPIAVGMKNIERFTIYNRYGQLVFSTTTNGQGWDGKVNGQYQQTSAFVWQVEAVDYNGKKYKEKGTTTLVR